MGGMRDTITCRQVWVLLVCAALLTTLLPPAGAQCGGNTCGICARRFGCMTAAWGKCCTQFFMHNGKKRSSSSSLSSSSSSPGGSGALKRSSLSSTALINKRGGNVFENLIEYVRLKSKIVNVAPATAATVAHDSLPPQVLKDSDRPHTSNNNNSNNNNSNNNNKYNYNDNNNNDKHSSNTDNIAEKPDYNIATMPSNGNIATQQQHGNNNDGNNIDSYTQQHNKPQQLQHATIKDKKLQQQHEQHMDVAAAAREPQHLRDE